MRTIDCGNEEQRRSQQHRDVLLYPHCWRHCEVVMCFEWLIAVLLTMGAVKVRDCNKGFELRGVRTSAEGRAP